MSDLQPGPSHEPGGPRREPTDPAGVHAPDDAQARFGPLSAAPPPQGHWSPPSGRPAGWEPSGTEPAWPVAYGAPSPHAPYGAPPSWPGASMQFDPADPLISANYAGWWGRGMAVLRAAWRPLLVLQIIGVVVGLVVQTPVDIVSALSDIDAQEAGEPVPDFPPLITALTIVAVLIGILIQLLVTIASIRTVVIVASGGRARPGREMAAAGRRMLPLLGWSIVAGLIAIPAVLACLFPVLYIAAVFVVLPAVVAFERTNAISRCFRLFHRDVGSAVARAATVGALAVGVFIVGFLLTLLAELALTGGDLLAEVSAPRAITSVVLLGVITGVLTLMYGMVFTPLMVTAYADLRARYEPLTTHDLVRELDQPSDTRPPRLGAL